MIKDRFFDMTIKLENFQNAIENMQDAVIISQCKGGYPIVFINEAFTQLTGYTLDNILEKSCDFLYKDVRQPDAEDVPEVVTMHKCMKARTTAFLNITGFKKNGDSFQAELSLSQIKNDRGRTTHYISVIRDVSIRASLEAQLFAENNRLYQENQALKLENKHDLITGLLNRSALKNEVRGLFLGAKRAKELFTLMFVSIDNLSDIAEKLDEHHYNMAVRHVAQFLQNSLKRQSDIVFRYADSEFVVCSVGQSADVSKQFAQVICQQIADARIDFEDVQANKADIQLSTSIGVATKIPEIYTEVSDFILAADLEMKAVKSAGGNAVNLSSFQ